MCVGFRLLRFFRCRRSAIVDRRSSSQSVPKRRSNLMYEVCAATTRISNRMWGFLVHTTHVQMVLVQGEVTVFVHIVSVCAMCICMRRAIFTHVYVASSCAWTRKIVKSWSMGNRNQLKRHKTIATAAAANSDDDDVGSSNNNTFTCRETSNSWIIIETKMMEWIELVCCMYECALNLCAG